MRRTVSLILFVLLFAAMLPVSAAAEEGPVTVSEETMQLLPSKDARLIRNYNIKRADDIFFDYILPQRMEEAEEEARREAEEAKRKAEEEAEAKRKAEKERKAKAKAEAKRKAEEVARVPKRTYDYRFGCKPSEVSRCDANRALGYHATVKHGWSGEQFQCLDTLWGRRESGWDNTLQNSSSSAYGIAQFIHNNRNSTWRNMGYAGPTSDPAIQIEAGIKYIEDRYRTPCRALAFSRATVSGNSSFAPSGLQSAARHWISRGYKGY